MLYISIITLIVNLVSLMFIGITYYWVSMIEYMSSPKNKKHHRSETICHTRCMHSTEELIEGPGDC